MGDAIQFAFEKKTGRKWLGHKVGCRDNSSNDAAVIQEMNDVPLKSSVSVGGREISMHVNEYSQSQCMGFSSCMLLFPQHFPGFYNAKYFSKYMVSH